MSTGMEGIWRARLAAVLGQWSTLADAPSVWLDDPEQLHEWRIAYRRLQTLLFWGPNTWRGELKPLLRSSGLKSSMQRSSPLRDLQVAIPRIAAWQGESPIDLQPVDAWLGDRLAAGMAEWVADWHATRPDRPLSEWLQTLHAGDTPVDDRVVREAFERAWRRWQRQIKHITGGNREVSGEAIHRVRITGKRVRYLGEWWRRHLNHQGKGWLRLEKRFHRAEGGRQDLRALAALMEEVRQAPGGAQGQRLTSRIVAQQRQGACWIHGRCWGGLEGLIEEVETALDAIERG